MGRELPGGKIASPAWKRSFSVGRDFSVYRWEESFLVGKELSGENRASPWDESFSVRRELPGGKGAYR